MSNSTKAERWAVRTLLTAQQHNPGFRCAVTTSRKAPRHFARLVAKGCRNDAIVTLTGSTTTGVVYQWLLIRTLADGTGCSREFDTYEALTQAVEGLPL